MAAVNKVGLVALPVGIALAVVASNFFVDVNHTYTFFIVPAVALVIVALTFLPLVRSGLQRRRLLVGGIPAEATVLDAAQTGTTMTIGAQQQFGVLLTLEVRAPGRAPYATRTEAFISIGLVRASGQGPEGPRRFPGLHAHYG
jgi:hypothetical protein